jgi:glycosyltransferase involved in cell wall biosynthesis
MLFKKYKDFVDDLYEDAILYSFNGEIVNEEKMDFPIDTKSLDEPIAIYTSTYNINDNGRGRANYISSEKMLKAFIDSLKGQSYKNWKLFIVGDCYEPEEELVDILKSNLDSKQYTLHNLSQPGERGKIDPKYLRNSGGVVAKNKAISLAKSEGFKYFASKDHDDIWKPNHLESMMQAFQQDPDISFGYHRASRARVKGDAKGVYYWGGEGKTPTLYYDDLPNKIIEAPHSGIVWNGPACGWPKYRNVPQMRSEAPKRNRIMGADEDFIRQCIEAMKEKEKKAIYVPKLLVRLRNAQGKLP